MSVLRVWSFLCLSFKVFTYAIWDFLSEQTALRFGHHVSLWSFFQISVTADHEIRSSFTLCEFFQISVICCIFTERSNLYSFCFQFFGNSENSVIWVEGLLADASTPELVLSS
jgi:hypothetical protein